jgi:hypothetical protein
MKAKTILAAAVLWFSLSSVTPNAWGGYTQIIGGPTFDENTFTGFPYASEEGNYGSQVNDSGTAVWSVRKHESAMDVGYRGVRWDHDGVCAELGNLGTYFDGPSDTRACAINDTGVAVGFATKYVGDLLVGERAVRWNPGQTAPTELGHLGTGPDDYTVARACAVNRDGTAVGYAMKCDGGSFLGDTAVRWNAGSTVATELDGLGGPASYAYDINDRGTVVGVAHTYVSGVDEGHAVRWEAGGTAVTVLDSADFASASAYHVNDSDTTAGSAWKYTGIKYGYVENAVRWDGDGTTMTELGNLGINTEGWTFSYTAAINNANTIAGNVNKYEAGVDKGRRAIRWDAGSTIATELGNLGSDSSGNATTVAYDLSEDGTIVGYSFLFEGDVRTDYHAVMWGKDNVAVDLNTLIDPDSGWVLRQALEISDNGQWIVGIGDFDPDGDGPLWAYQRLWTIQVPEPATLSLLALGGLAVLRRRRNA